MITVRLLTRAENRRALREQLPVSSGPLSLLFAVCSSCLGSVPLWSSITLSCPSCLPCRLSCRNLFVGRSVSVCLLCRSVGRSLFCLPVCMSVCCLSLSVCLSVCLSVLPSVRPSVSVPLFVGVVDSTWSRLPLWIHVYVHTNTVAAQQLYITGQRHSVQWAVGPTASARGE
jgi:hypothetical protein